MAKEVYFKAGTSVVKDDYGFDRDLEDMSWYVKRIYYDVDTELAILDVQAWEIKTPNIFKFNMSIPSGSGDFNMSQATDYILTLEPFAGSTPVE